MGLNNPFPYSNDNKRYHTFNYYLKQKYHNKIAKVSLDAGFTCPNRDGLVSTGGCRFCSSEGSGEFAGNRLKNVLDQFNDIKTKQLMKWPNAQFIAYFQAYTNTYGSLAQLKELYEPFVSIDDVKAISIATRPDCLNQEIIDYLKQLNKKKDLWIELGLQTTNDQTAISFNRGYLFKTFKDTLGLLNEACLNVCVHVINGLENETIEDMKKTVFDLSQLNIQGIKIHLCHIIKGTEYEKRYLEGKIKILDRDDYINLVCDQLEMLNSEVVIHRLTGDAKKEDLVAPLYSLKKVTILNDIDKELARRNSYQGKYYQKKLG